MRLVRENATVTPQDAGFVPVYVFLTLLPVVLYPGFVALMDKHRWIGALFTVLFILPNGFFVDLRRESSRTAKGVVVSACVVLMALSIVRRDWISANPSFVVRVLFVLIAGFTVLRLAFAYQLWKLPRGTGFQIDPEPPICGLAQREMERLRAERENDAGA